MIPAGYSGTPLSRKLGIKPGQRVATLGAPPHFPSLLDHVPAGVDLVADPAPPGEAGAPGSRAWDVVVAFAPDRAALAERLPVAVSLVTWSGGLWVAWPKGSSPLASDLNREGVREAGLETGLVDHKVCAIDEDWSGLRFVHRVENRPG